MKVTFGRRVLDAMPVTAKHTLMSQGVTIATPMQKNNEFHSFTRFNGMEVLVVPVNSRNIRNNDPVEMDQMYRCKITATETKGTPDEFGPCSHIKDVKVDAELIPGNTVSASALMSTYDVNAYVPNEIHAAIRQAIVEVAVDTMKDPNA